MIFVDTSVWIEFFRGKDAHIVNILSSLLDRDKVLLCPPVRVELLSGTTQKTISKLSTLLAAVPSVKNEAVSWDMVEKWIVSSRMIGQAFGVMDLIIASYAKREGAAIWSLDSDFRRMEKLKMIRTYNVV